MTEKIQITSEEDVLVYEDRVERVRCEMFQMVLINRVMERRELELPASGDEIREVYDQLKGKKGARRIEIAELKTSIPELNECLQGSNVNRRTLSELDFLARRVQQMTEREREIFKTAAGFSRELTFPRTWVATLFIRMFSQKGNLGNTLPRMDTKGCQMDVKDLWNGSGNSIIRHIWGSLPNTVML